MAMVYCRLFLYRWGFCGVDVTSLVKNFDLMRLELRSSGSGYHVHGRLNIEFLPISGRL